MRVFIFIAAFFLTSLLQARNVFSQVMAMDSTIWDLQGQSGFVDYQGRKSVFLNGGAAVLKNLELRDGVMDVDVSTPAARGFFGIQFRISEDGVNGEWVYLRQHKSGLADAMQYTPILNTGLNWQLYSGPGFIGAVDIPKNEWFHLRLEVSGAQARLFVKNMDKPVLVMDDLKSGIQKGSIALAVLTGATYFSNFEVKKTTDAPWVRKHPAMLPNVLKQWEISPSMDALSRNVESPLTQAEKKSIVWQSVETEAPGMVTLYRYREAPHLRVSFANDFSKRLEAQPGSKIVYAKTKITSDRDQIKKLYIGYSDEVCVFLNGQILYRGRSAQYFRDPGFLGIMDSENDALYIPLKKGDNELILAVSELGGGWGFICRLE